MLTPGLNFMALLTVSNKSALTEAGNFALTSSIFHGFSRDILLVYLCTCVLHVTRHSSLTQLAQKFGTCPVSEEWWLLAQNSSVSRARKLGPGQHQQWPYVALIDHANYTMTGSFGMD